MQLPRFITKYVYYIPSGWTSQNIQWINTNKSNYTCLILFLFISTTINKYNIDKDKFMLYHFIVTWCEKGSRWQLASHRWNCFNLLLCSKDLPDVNASKIHSIWLSAHTFWYNSTLFPFFSWAFVGRKSKYNVCSLELKNKIIWEFYQILNKVIHCIKLHMHFD